MDTETQPEMTDDRRQFETLLSESKRVMARIMVIDNRLCEIQERIFGAAPRSECLANASLPPVSLLARLKVTHDRTVHSLDSVESRLTCIEGAA